MTTAAHPPDAHRIPPVAVDGVPTLRTALARIADRANGLDAAPRFPAENFSDLAAAGVVQLAADRGLCNLVREIELVRTVAAADAATARILDGHFNGVERLACAARRRWSTTNSSSSAAWRC